MELKRKKTADGLGYYYVHPTAIVDKGAIVGDGTRIWHFAHVRSDAVIGSDCNIGKGVYVEGHVGDNCKLQNNVNVYKGVVLGNYVFVGPNATFTNDQHPRAANHQFTITPTYVNDFASIGAGATVRCGVIIGKNAMVGAGAVVTKNVPTDAVVMGVPAVVA